MQNCIAGGDPLREPQAHSRDVRQSRPPEIARTVAPASLESEIDGNEREHPLSALRQYHRGVCASTRELDAYRVNLCLRIKRLNIVAPNRRDQVVGDKARIFP